MEDQQKYGLSTGDFNGHQRGHWTDHEHGDNAYVTKVDNMLFGITLKNKFQLHMITIFLLGLRDQRTVNKEDIS